MALHVIGERCPACRRKGLVLGAFNPLTGSAVSPFSADPLAFRPMGWRLERLSCMRAACSHCGYVIVALTPEALQRLREALKKERLDETFVYHPKRRRKKT
jgi:hypothetical protein